MDRRAFLGTVAGSLLAAPLAAEAQTAGKVWQIGLLDYSSPDPARLSWWTAFRERLGELGYADGRNVMFQPRWAHGQVSRLPDLAAELVGLKVDILVTGGTEAVLAAQRATKTIPIVTTTSSDPVELGLTASLARPGGNLTGVTSIASELSGKRLQLVRELVPGASRIAVLWDRDNRSSALAVRDTEAVAGPLRVTLQLFPVRSGDFPAAFSAMKRDRTEALIVTPSPAFFPGRRRVADLALAHRLPTVVGSREYAEAGGLMSYAADYPELFRHAAAYVDKILHGARPGDLPIEQPTKFELVINLKTAKALGLTIPPSLLLRADQVIE